MVKDDRYCIDVLTQASEVTKSLQRVAAGMFDDHLLYCVVDAVEKSRPEGGPEEADRGDAAVTRSTIKAQAIESSIVRGRAGWG